MMWQRWMIWFFVVSGTAFAQRNASQATQIPASVKNEVLAIQDNFVSALEEECPLGKCYPVGCDVGRFLTLDETQTSSLPGLDAADQKPVAAPQYKLASVRCEFTYEASITDEALAALRQRLGQRVKLVGVSVNLSARKLDPKPVEDISAPANRQLHNDAMASTWYGALYLTLLPFIPWFLLAVILVMSALALLWGYRRLGKEVPRIDPATGAAVGGASTALARVEPTPLQVISRIQSLRELIDESPRIVEISLKADLDAQNFAGLAMFLRHFGTQFLSPFKDRHEYREALGKLATFYKDQSKQETASELWEYLDGLERSLVAAKVQVDQEPLDAEFSFMAALTVEELVGILKDVSQQEAVAAIAYAPRGLRERFFANTNPNFMVNFIEQLTHVDKLPDSFVREAARKMRRIYYAKGGDLKTVSVDKYPLLEQALNALEPGKRRQLVIGMSKENPDLISSIAPTVFLDESLMQLDDNSLTEAFLAAEPAHLVEYLLAFPDGKQIYARLDGRLREAIGKDIRWGREADTRSASIARQAVAAFVKRLDARGVINLREINEKLLT